MKTRLNVYFTDGKILTGVFPWLIADARSLAMTALPKFHRFELMFHEHPAPAGAVPMAGSEDVSDPKGDSFEPEHDQARLAAQFNGVLSLMLGSQWRTLGEIAKVTGYPEASVSARLRQIRNEHGEKYEVSKRRRGDPSAGLFEYQVCRRMP